MKIPCAEIAAYLNKDLAKKVKELSTGQKAILSLAKIFCANCDVLLLDEPTNHLDFDRLAILEEFLMRILKASKTF